MTEQEFKKFVEDQKEKGKSEKDIVTIFAKMFQDKKCTRDEFEGLINAMGYELSPELANLDDDELRSKVIKKSDDEIEKGKNVDEAKIDPDGEPAPNASAKKTNDGEDEDENKDNKSKSTKSESSDDDKEKDDDDEEDERKEAMSLFGLKD